MSNMDPGDSPDVVLDFPTEVLICSFPLASDRNAAMERIAP
jgi:hypothetical protein